MHSSASHNGTTSSWQSCVDYDIHGLVGVRLLDPQPRDVLAVSKQLGPMLKPLERPAEATSAKTVTIHGVEGTGIEATLFTNDDGSRSLLAWQEGKLSFLVGGDLTAEQALAIAESLQ